MFQSFRAGVQFSQPCLYTSYKSADLEYFNFARQNLELLNFRHVCNGSYTNMYVLHTVSVGIFVIYLYTNFTYTW
jgi:hypothetical protein